MIFKIFPETRQLMNFYLNPNTVKVPEILIERLQVLICDQIKTVPTLILTH